MAITVNFNGASIRQPGAYSKSSVNLSGGFPLAPTGVVAIIGEADGGEPGSAGVKTYTSEDISALIADYKSGPIVDAARLLVAPARDNRVPNGASQIRIYKVNNSTKATLNLENPAAAGVFKIDSANWGEDENLISVKVEAGSSANQKLITVSKGTLTETLSENPADVMMQIQYTGSEATATMQIQLSGGSKHLVVTAGADSIDINLGNKTIQDVVDLVSANVNYTASTTLARASSRSAEDLDFISTATDVKTSVVSLYGAQKELINIINSESSLVVASQLNDIEGIPDNTAKKFLAGGSRGAAANSDFQAGFDAMLALRCNTVVPLISRDATALASEGLTDPASTYTVNAVNLQALTHCITASNTKNRSERNCYLSIKDSFQNSIAEARNLNNERASMLFQDVQVLDASGNISYKEPWAAACMLAGIQSGTAVGTPATFKLINALGIQHSDYNAKTQIDLAIDAGLLPLAERDQGGFRVVVHNTTYGADPNFVYNRASVLEAADYVAFNMRQQLEAIFVGGKVSSTLAIDVKDTIVAIMETFLNAQIIVGDDTNNGLGFKDLVVTVNGNIVEIDITITPVQGVDFMLNRITLDTIRQSA